MPASTPTDAPVRRTSFASRDEAEVTAFIRETYAENHSRFASIRAGARFSARTNDTDVVGADRLRTSIDYEGTTAAEGFGHYTFFTVNAGTVQLSSPDLGVTAGPGDVAFYPLGVPIDFVMRGFDVTTLRLSPQRVAQVAEDLTGVPGEALRFHDVVPVSDAMRRYWRSVVLLVGGALGDPDSPLTSPLLAEDLARTAAAAALHTFPNTTLGEAERRGPGSVAPAAVRRAVAHIEDNAHLPLRLDEIAAAAGTGARALQHGFRRHLGTTPLGHLRRVRLARAHQELRESDPTSGVTVAEVATRWGFANPGRFAAAHRDAYGVPPSETLRR